MSSGSTPRAAPRRGTGCGASTVTTETSVRYAADYYFFTGGSGAGGAGGNGG